MFKIITQTSDFVVVAKRAGVNFHDEGKLGSGLFSQVKAHLKKHSDISELYPVHRLDKMTSGLLIFATSLSSAQMFNDLFKHHLVEKYYLAISDTKPSKKQGLIKGDMAKSRRGMYKLMRSMDNPAITQFFSYSQGEGKRLYMLKPHSGKTHQLRVALSSIGSPIMGDPLYYSYKSPEPEMKSTVDRGYLHAYALKFNFADKQYEFTLAPNEGELFVTKNIKNKLNELGQPWLLSWPKL